LGLQNEFVDQVPIKHFGCIMVGQIKSLWACVDETIVNGKNESSYPLIWSQTHSCSAAIVINDFKKNKH
jgi:hypothetical protein